MKWDYIMQIISDHLFEAGKRSDLRSPVAGNNLGKGLGRDLVESVKLPRLVARQTAPRQSHLRHWKAFAREGQMGVNS